MNILNISAWIFAYSFCLVHITLFAVIYSKYRIKIELYYLLALSNLALMTVIQTLFIILDKDIFFQILLNFYLSMYITIPLYIYKLFNVDKKYNKYIFLLVIIQAVIENIFMAYNFFNIIYITRGVFYLLLLIPLFVKKKIKFEKGTVEWKVENMTIKTAFVFLCFMVLLIPFLIFLSETPYVFSLFWAVFTLSYQIPGLLYCKARLQSQLPEKTVKTDKNGLSVLTKRENEVALAICEGYKYEEIAKRLFISLSAVKKHSYNIYRKLDIHNNRELIHAFMEKKGDSGEKT